MSANGIWLLVAAREYFVSFENFPWFKEASIADILDIECPHVNHLYWPRLDVDLSVESLADPEKFPKVSKKSKRRYSF